MSGGEEELILNFLKDLLFFKYFKKNQFLKKKYKKILF